MARVNAMLGSLAYTEIHVSNVKQANSKKTLEILFAAVVWIIMGVTRFLIMILQIVFVTKPMHQQTPFVHAKTKKLCVFVRLD